MSMFESPANQMQKVRNRGVALALDHVRSHSTEASRDRALSLLPLPPSPYLPLPSFHSAIPNLEGYMGSKSAERLVLFQVIQKRKKGKKRGGGGGKRKIDNG